MLTIFTTAKAFRGHLNVIQRNALKSWTLLHTDVEIILFGEDQGSSEAAKDLGIRHEPEVGRNEFGTILVSSMFEKAQAISRHDLLCYVNCDIVLLSDFRAALDKVKAKEHRFLMVGRRWDTDITEPLAFGCPEWDREVRELALRSGRQRTPSWIDYFAFSRGTFGGNIPEFAIGRTCWDNWLVWKAMSSGGAVVDASRLVVAVHQNHDYSHHSGGIKGVWFGEEAARNFQLTGGLEHFRTISHSPYCLTTAGIKRNRFHKMAYAWWRTKQRITLAATRAVIAWQNAVWHQVLEVTRPVRSALGWRKTGTRPMRKP
ncbi:MAG TPA: hypothetical protein VIH76_19360 [Candidatus Acidoferrales bacterium]